MTNTDSTTLTTVTIMENAYCRLVARWAELDAGTPDTRRRLIARIACTPVEGDDTSDNPDEFINHLLRRVAVTAGELALIYDWANQLLAEAVRRPRNIGEVQIWRTLIEYGCARAQADAMTVHRAACPHCPHCPPF
jgi:hypothetical protein